MYFPRLKLKRRSPGLAPELEAHREIAVLVIFCRSWVRSQAEMKKCWCFFSFFFYFFANKCQIFIKSRQ